jgi:hypothetical protein
MVLRPTVDRKPCFYTQQLIENHSFTPPFHATTFVVKEPFIFSMCWVNIYMYLVLG